MEEHGFLIEKYLWEDEAKLGKLMKEYIFKLRKFGIGEIKDYDGIALFIRPAEEKDLQK